MPILDRRVEFDERSRGFPVRAMFTPEQAEISIDEVRSYTWSVPVALDQGSEGACFPAGTLVRLANGSHIPIEEVRLLDEVVTAEGRTGHVEQTMVRWHAEGLYKVRLRGLAGVRMTAEHPVLTKHGYVAARDLKIGDYAAVPKHAIGRVDEIQTRRFLTRRSPSHALSRRVVHHDRWGGSAVSVITPVPETIPLTQLFGRLVGLYLAEGSTTESKVVWTFGKHERETLAVSTVELIEECFGAQARIQDRPQVVNVVLYGKDWRSVFDGLFRRGSHDKWLGELATGPREFLTGVLAGWMAGDGHHRRSSLQGVTVSRRLAYDMHGVAQAVGMTPALRHSPGKATGRVKHRYDRYDIEMGVGGGKNLPEQDDGAVWRRVSEIGEEPWQGFVYNLHVRGDNSYVADGLGVHNCVGFSWAQELAARPWADPNITNDYALAIYYWARQHDEWPGEDYEGTSVLAGAKAVSEWLERVTQYRWAFGLDDAIRAIAYKGPLVFGTNWYTGMMRPDSSGRIQPTGHIEGGHAILVPRVTGMRYKLSGMRRRVFVFNSWGATGGWPWAWLTWDDFERLLHEQGEACIPVIRR